ncbi:MAG: peptidoglycan DD-metalloendopeptidase family protein [Porticoccaceae bacterium]|nr:peptidoglycan DD-metalloendopeptidase family protein [Porticoccaceae bacterium]
MKKLSAIKQLALRSVLLLIFSTVAFAADTDKEKEKQKLDNLKRAISSLEKRLDKRNQEKNILVNQLKKVELEAAKTGKSIRQLNSQINRRNKKLSSLEKQKKDLQQDIKNQNAAISEHLAAAYKLGDQEPIKLLLNQEDPQQLSRLFKYYGYFLDARNKKIETYVSDVEKLSTLVTEVTQQKLLLDSSKKELVRDQNQFLVISKRRSAALNKLNISLQSDQSKLNKLIAERAELEELLNTVEVAVSEMNIAPPPSQQSFVSQKGLLQWPLKGRVAHSYGSKRSGTLRWEGWMIGAKSGQSVNAVHDGQVIFSNYLRGFGLLIILNHGDGYMTLYAHNKELLKDTGDWVLSSESIARAGDTGGLDKPALYFEIRKKGQPADPKAWLGKR